MNLRKKDKEQRPVAEKHRCTKRRRKDKKKGTKHSFHVGCTHVQNQVLGPKVMETRGGRMDVWEIKRVVFRLLHFPILLFLSPLSPSTRE